MITEETLTTDSKLFPKCRLVETNKFISETGTAGLLINHYRTRTFESRLQITAFIQKSQSSNKTLEFNYDIPFRTKYEFGSEDVFMKAIGRLLESDKVLDRFTDNDRKEIAKFMVDSPRRPANQ